jgi:hypothetical protein
MHKSIFIAVVAIFLIASPYMMFGTLNSNMFSNAMAIKEGGSESNIIIKSDVSKEQVKSSDEAADEAADEGSDESSDEGSDESSDEGSDESSVEAADESSDEGSDESSDEGSDESSDEG